jgi:hypothetical protein
MGSTSTLQSREEESFYTYPKKTSHWKLEHSVLETGTSDIWKLAVGAHLPKPDHPIFSGSVRCGVCVTIVFHSSHLDI